MLSAIKLIFAGLFGNLLARVLTGAGFAVVTGAVMIPVVTSALDAAAGAMGGMSGDMLGLVNLAGFGSALSIIGSAMLTRTVMLSGKLGLTKAAA